MLPRLPKLLPCCGRWGTGRAEPWVGTRARVGTWGRGQPRDSQPSETCGSCSSCPPSCKCPRQGPGAGRGAARRHASSGHAENPPHPLLTPPKARDRDCAPSELYSQPKGCQDFEMTRKDKPNSFQLKPQHYSRHLKQKVSALFSFRRKPPVRNYL